MCREMAAGGRVPGGYAALGVPRPWRFTPERRTAGGTDSCHRRTAPGKAVPGLVALVEQTRCAPRSVTLGPDGIQRVFSASGVVSASTV